MFPFFVVAVVAEGPLATPPPLGDSDPCSRLDSLTGGSKEGTLYSAHCKLPIKWRLDEVFYFSSPLLQ